MTEGGQANNITGQAMTLKTIAASACCIRAGGQFFFQSIAALALSLVMGLAQAQPSTRQISLPNQDYTESTEDLVVKVLGGQVAINRTWTFGRWYLNDRWADLVLQPDPLGGVLAVNRADRIYTRVSGTAQPTYRFDENNTIKATGPDAAPLAGWQWYDREGNTIDYDATGHMLGWANAAGVKVTLARDSQGRLSAVKDHHGREVLTLQYNASGQPTTISDPSGRSVHYEWSVPGASAGTGPNGSIGTALLTQVTEGHASSFIYNSQGQVTTQTNALGYTTRHSYDAAGNRTSSTNALNETTSYGYDARGRRTQTVSPEGRKQVVVYDSAGRVTETMAPGQSAGQGTRIGYDQAGNQSQITSPSGLVTKTSYDSQGRFTKTEDPAGNVTTYEYGDQGTPLAGLLTATHYPTYKETYQYDQRGRQTAITQHLSADQTRTQHQGYDALGQRISSTDPAGRTTLYQYDGLGRLTQTTDPLAQHTRQGWNAHDQLVSLTDAKGNTHRFEYDKRGKIIKEIRPMGGSILYSYDAVGDLVKRKDAGGNIRTYIYNAAGSRTEEIHNINIDLIDQHITYQYDKDEKLTKYIQNDNNGALISSAIYTKDIQGRTSQRTVTYGKVNDSGVLSFTLGQSFDQDGQLASHTYPDGSQQTYVYTNGLLSKVTLPNGGEISYQDCLWIQPARVQTPGVTKILSFDALLRPIGITVKNNANQILTNRVYQYNSAGDITQIQSDLGKTTYDYDPLRRLTQASPDSSLQALGLPQEQYSYDAVGNRLTSAHQPGTWSYNEDNQLVQYPRTTPFSAVPPINTQVSYTPQGHVQKETNNQGERTYGYNAAEQLVEVSQPGQIAQYRYDPMGRRIAKHVQQGSTTHTIYFLYGEQGLMGEANAQGQITTAYGFNPNAAQKGLWSADPIWQANLAVEFNANLGASTTVYHYLHTDHLGTPILATTKEGRSSWKAMAEAFGATSTLWGDSETTINLRLPGQYADEETKSYYNFRRYYDPSLGRYFQGDPLGLNGGLNFYFYVDGAVLLNIDPEGLIRVRPIWGPVPVGPGGGGDPWHELPVPPPSVPIPTIFRPNDDDQENAIDTNIEIAIRNWFISA